MLTPSPAFTASAPIQLSPRTAISPYTQRERPPPAHRPAYRHPIASAKQQVTVLDYGAGNVRSLENAVRLFDFDIKWAETPDDISNASKLIFPGVGSFGNAMHNLREKGFVHALTGYLQADRPFLGICLGLHTLFDASEESPDVAGLGVFPGVVRKFRVDPPLAVPHMGWNTVLASRPSFLLSADSNEDDRDWFYFVHSYRLGLEVIDSIGDAALATTVHGEQYLSVLQRGNVCAAQFHPEKSGPAGLRLIRNFLTRSPSSVAVAPTTATSPSLLTGSVSSNSTGLSKRVVACLDVRENDAGDLVVTKGDQYDVRDSTSRAVRNLGKPVALAHRYFSEGADEIAFLNITSFRGEPVSAAPMIEVLRLASEKIFVPLTIGGGIRDYTDNAGRFYSALDVADMYFRAGADKVSLGSDAVYAAEAFLRDGACNGSSSIERISHVYGAQAVVVSVDPKRVYVDDEDDDTIAQLPYTVVTHDDGRRCWYQCTVKGGREGRPIDVVQLVTAVEKLGAGEILLNSMDQDGQNAGYDLKLVNIVNKVVSIPVIASSGAGRVEHFTECFDVTNVEAALAAGIFHREEVSIGDVKFHMRGHGTPVRTAPPLETVVRPLLSQ